MLGIIFVSVLPAVYEVVKHRRIGEVTAFFDSRRARHHRRPRGARRAGHVPDDGLHPGGQPVDPVGGRRAGGRRGRGDGADRRPGLDPHGARRERADRAGARHGAERLRRVPGRAGGRRLAGRDGPHRPRRRSSSWPSCCSGCAKRSRAPSRSICAGRSAPASACSSSSSGSSRRRSWSCPASTVAALSEHPGLTLPPVTAGDWSAPGPLIAIVGVRRRRVPAGARPGRRDARRDRRVGAPRDADRATWRGPAPSSRGRASTRFFQADVRAALDWRLLPLLFSLVLVDFFDTVGTVTAIGDAAGLTGRDGLLPRLQAGPGDRRDRGGDRRRQRGELGDVLHRVGGGRRRRRAHRPALGVRRAAVPGVDGPGADRRRGAGRGDGAGADPRPGC